MIPVHDTIAVTYSARQMEKFVGRTVYVPDESIIIELRESVSQVVKSDRCNFLKFIVLKQRVLGQPVCRPGWIRVRQIKIVLRIIQHLNTAEQKRRWVDESYTGC